jgi:hypothetical protein
MEILENHINNYENTKAGNNYIFHEFTARTNSIPYLRAHRDYIEKHNLGFGERAFQYMWYLIIKHICTHNLSGNVLEIGVFKGQIISLWKLISKMENLDIKVNGITPLEGNSSPKIGLLKSILFKFSSKFRENSMSGNFYLKENYLQIIDEVFNHFELDIDTINILKGYSTDLNIYKAVENEKFSLIYIDGDHTFEGVTKDINMYASLVEKGGFLVMDDAACNIPGNDFWKGHQSVSDACKIIDALPFRNVLNVGHNRIYQKN